MEVFTNATIPTCLPWMHSDEGGWKFDEIVVDGISYSGQALMDYVDRKAQNAYFMAEESPEKEDAMDFMWYLWWGPSYRFTVKVR